MTNHERRQVLKYAGLAVAAGGFLPGAATAAADDGTGDESDGPSATAQGWASLRGNAGNTGFAPDETGPAAPVTVDWEYEHGGPVAVVDGTAYLTVDETIHALDADDGSLVDEIDVPGAAGGPAVVGTSLYVGGDRLTALDLESGDVRWRADLEHDDGIPAPVVAEGTVFVVAGGTLHALDADSGDEAWQFGPADGSLLEQTAAAADGAVFTSDGETLYAHEIDDGTERWSATDGGLRRQVIVATDETVSVQAGGLDDVVVYDTETGAVRWTGYGYVSGLATDESIYALIAGDIVGYDREDGEETWRPAVDSATYGAPVTDGETVYVGVSSSTAGTGVVALDLEDGEIEWVVETETHPEHLAIADGTVYASADGLLAIRSSDEADGADETDADDESDEDEAEADADADANDADGEYGGDEVDDESDTTADDADEAGGDDAGDDGNGTGENDSLGNGDEDDENGSAESDGNETETETEDDPAEDGVPGFTAGAGLAGGALTLEWLRRRGIVDAADDEA